MPGLTDHSERVDRLHQHGLVDMHFDLLMDLYEKRQRHKVIETDFLSNLLAGDIGVLGAAIYLDNQYLPEMGLRVALDQIARLYAEVDECEPLQICRSYTEITQALQKNHGSKDRQTNPNRRIAMLITMEGVEPLGGDIDLLRAFFELGLRSLSLTHARRNAAGDGGVFATSGSSPAGLTTFGRQVVEECERLGIIVDLAHLNPAGFDDVLELTSRPPIISHTNPRRFYNIERNSSDEQIHKVAERGGVVGVSSILLSPDKGKVTLDYYVEQIQYIANLGGIESVGLGFDFFKFIYDGLSQDTKARLPEVTFMRDLHHHGHARNLTARLIKCGMSDESIEKILYGNFMRVLQEWL